MIFKGVRTAAILLASLTSRSACSDEAAEDALNKLESPLTAIRAELAQVQATLPAVGVEHEMACDPRLAATVKLYTLDERRLNAITGTRAIAETKAVLDQAHALTLLSQASRAPRRSPKLDHSDRLRALVEPGFAAAITT